MRLVLRKRHRARVAVDRLVAHFERDGRLGRGRDRRRSIVHRTHVARLGVSLRLGDGVAGVLRRALAGMRRFAHARSLRQGGGVACVLRPTLAVVAHVVPHEDVVITGVPPVRASEPRMGLRPQAPPPPCNHRRLHPTGMPRAPRW
ncbi:MAG: hypothetical protein U1F67_21210 [Rubrivivax sp.]